MKKYLNEVLRRNNIKLTRMERGVYVYTVDPSDLNFEEFNNVVFTKIATMFFDLSYDKRTAKRKLERQVKELFDNIKETKCYNDSGSVLKRKLITAFRIYMLMKTKTEEKFYPATATTLVNVFGLKEQIRDPVENEEDA